MIVYWLLLLPTALIAYLLGSMDTVVLASNFVFRRNLRRFGQGNIWISNFRRVYGLGGFVRLLLVEIVRDVIPVLIGGLLLGFKGHADAGRAVAGLCLVLGRLYPLFYDFRGSHACICLAVAAMSVNFSMGAAVLVVLAAVTALSRYVTLGTVSAAAVCAAVAVLMVDDSLLRRLVIIAAALVLVKHIPAFIRLVGGREERLENVQDVTYKFDEKF